uniref:Tenascin-X n=1 Tax=Anthurium amnicola TaxID=1678845 RepID=A0A1D1XIH2_9ARAE
MKNCFGLSLFVFIVVVFALLLSDNAVHARPRDYYKNGLNTRQFSPTPCDPTGTCVTGTCVNGICKCDTGIGAGECDNGEACGANDDCSSGKCKKKVCVAQKRRRGLFK